MTEEAESQPTAPTSEQAAELREFARAFVGAAFEVLGEDHVIPTPVFHPFIEVGRDYGGPEISGLPECRAFEARLNELYPERFANPLERPHPEFANAYTFSLLEACVARCAREGEFDAASPGVDESLDELLMVLGTASYEVVCCRFVTHLTTATGAEIQIGEVTVVPETEEFEGLERRLQQEIRGAATAFNRQEPRPYDPPHALLITREVTDDPDPYAVSRRLSGRLERFLLLARLLTAGTVLSAYEVTGMTTLVARMGSELTTFGKGMPELVRRTVRLAGDEGAAFKKLGQLLDAADVKRTGMVATSFDVALSKFHRSHSSGSAYEHLVDLATALEAILAGGEGDNEGLTLRLRSRVAALLATEADPAQALFRDVGVLYGLRSTLVHGGEIKESDLRKNVRRISTVADGLTENRFGLAIGYAVDRMRDLVRRSILARLCLAAEPDPLWPFSGSTAVDATLSDDAERIAWRSRWRDRLAELGVGAAAGPARSAVDFLSPEDR